MKTVSRIITDNPVQQLWKLLRLYLDVPWVSDEIRRLHSIPKDKHKENVRKQATQIGYCIRQAEEYFQASSKVGLATRPVLLYYGAMSLSQALFLLKLDGEHSLDALRKVTKHNHHGLELIRGLAGAIRPDCDVSEFYDALRAAVYTKPTELDSETNQAWGHFSLFYKSLCSHDYHLLSSRLFTANSPAHLQMLGPAPGPGKQRLVTVHGF